MQGLQFLDEQSDRELLHAELESLTADSQSVCLGVEPTLWTFDQTLLPFQELESVICWPVSVRRPL
jgi:hypothetical protein